MMMLQSKKSKSVVALLGFLIVSGIILFIFNTHKEQKADSLAFDPKNGTYEIEGKEITLVDGYAESELAPGSASKLITRYFGNEAMGDLNGDGKEDVVFLITQETGGSGVFYHVVVALGTNVGYSGLNGIFIGDRIAPQSTEIKDGKVFLNYAVRARGASMTTVPNIGVTRYYKISNGRLVQFK
jgi:hypothetical protein